MDRTYIEKHANQLIFFLAILIATIVTAAAIGRTRTAEAAKRQEHLAEEVLRFRVLANSDSQRDQELKLKVRDAGPALIRSRSGQRKLRPCPGISM